MTKIRKAEEFKDFDKFNKVLDKKKFKTGRFGGLKVSLKVTVEGEKCIISVSRNQLAKLALSLAKKNEDDKDIAENFSQLKAKLNSLEKRQTPGHLSKRLGNFIFKVLHFGKGRTQLLNRKELYLQANQSSSDSSSTDESSESKKVSRSETIQSSESSESKTASRSEPRKKSVSSESHSESEEWQPPKDKNAPVNLEKWTNWLAKNGFNE